MEGEDQDTLLNSTGHEGHEVHVCRRCGWPFPNAHPSAKDRIAHKKVCGTIEGYEIVNPEEHQQHLAVSNNEYEHTPTPKLSRETDRLGTTRAGEKSNKSEDDVFSDAVTEFSEGRTSPQLGEGSESAEGPYKSMKWKSLEGDFYGSKLLKLEEIDDNAESEAISDEAMHGVQTELVKTMISVDSIDEYGDDGFQQGIYGLASKRLDAERGQTMTVPEAESATTIIHGNTAHCVGDGSENIKLEPSSYVETAPVPEDDQVINGVKKDADKFEHSKTVCVEAGDKDGEGAFVQVPVLLDSAIPSNYSTEVTRDANIIAALTSKPVALMSVILAEDDQSRICELLNSSESNHVVEGQTDVNPEGNAIVGENLPIPSLRSASVLGDDKSNFDIDHDGGVDSKSLHDVGDDQQYKRKDHVSAMDLSASSSNISGSLAGNCGSVSLSDTLETSSQKDKITNERANTLNSDDFDPPSFMTLIQSPAVANQSIGPSDIGMIQKNQQLKSDGLRAGWFPSLTNVVNESEGRKKNEEVIAKVTNWNTVNQQSPLRNLLDDPIKSLNKEQVPATQEEDPIQARDDFVDLTNVSSDLAPKYQDTFKEEESNSPAKHPIEIKKEKKRKGKSFWAPLVCCTSVHRDM